MNSEHILNMEMTRNPKGVKRWLCSRPGERSSAFVFYIQCQCQQVVEACRLRSTGGPGTGIESECSEGLELSKKVGTATGTA